MRPLNGKTVQRTEVCFRGLAGCLRRPKGGGSRPRVIVVKGSDVRTRLLSPGEAASLMGLKSSYRLPEIYDYAFRVIGDGVAVPVVSFLRAKLLNPATQKLRNSSASLAQVADLVGYSSEAAFSRAFKKAFGTAPAAWRRSNR
jgi:DNA (cytosine-5)-methyltransferase 1